MWLDKPFDRRSAWLDMLLMANHDENRFLLGNELVEVKRGSFITSELKLMERWGWSKTKIRNFLKLLEKDKMILKISDKKKTTIIIENYSDYQDKRTIEEPHGDHTETTERPQENTNKNVKNIKNDKECKEDIPICDKDEKISNEKPKKETIYEPVISYLNQKTNKAYKANTKKTKDLIDARVNEGFALEDFTKVIDIKTTEWLNDTNMEKFLRPETLFGNKFESYLNQKVTAIKPQQTAKPNKFHNFDSQMQNLDLEKIAEERRNKLKERFNKG